MKILSLILVLLSLVGCSEIVENHETQVYYEDNGYYENYKLPALTLSNYSITPQNMRGFIYNLPYKNDKEFWKQDDYWQSPEQTLKLGHGDCEDRAILGMVVWNTLFNQKGTLSIIVTKEGKRPHAMFTIQSNGTTYLPFAQDEHGLTLKQYFEESGFDRIIYTLSYSHSLYIAHKIKRFAPLASF